MDPALPVSIQALAAVIVIGVATPLLTALFTKAGAPEYLKSLFAGFVAAAGTVTAYLVDVKGVPDWQHVLGLFVAGLAAAVAFRNVDPGVEKAVKHSTPNFGLTAPSE